MIIKIVIPTAISGIITGVMLAIARVTGETAPLLLTTFLAQDVNWNAFEGSQEIVLGNWRAPLISETPKVSSSRDPQTWDPEKLTDAY